MQVISSTSNTNHEDSTICCRSKLARKGPTAPNLNNVAPIRLTPPLEQQSNQTKWVVDTVAGVTSAIAKASEKMLFWSHSALESQNLCNFRFSIVFDWWNRGEALSLSRVTTRDRQRRRHVISTFNFTQCPLSTFLGQPWRRRERKREWCSSFEEVTNTRIKCVRTYDTHIHTLANTGSVFRVSPYTSNSYSKCSPRWRDDPTRVRERFHWFPYDALM